MVKDEHNRLATWRRRFVTAVVREANFLSGKKTRHRGNGSGTLDFICVRYKYGLTHLKYVLSDKENV